MGHEDQSVSSIDQYVHAYSMGHYQNTRTFLLLCN